MSVKVMKYLLTYVEGAGDYHNALNELWKIQRATREILNKTIQEAYHWDYRSDQHKQETGEPLSIKEVTGYKNLDGYVYHILSAKYPELASDPLNAAVRKGLKKYKDSRKDVFVGTMSIPSYKSDQPILLKPRSMKFSHSTEKGNLVSINLFSQLYQEENGYRYLSFTIHACDGTQKSILSRVLSGEYKLSESQLVYEKKKWLLFLSYNHPTEEHELDPDKILGIDMGAVYAVYCSSKNEHGALAIEGQEVLHHAQEIEARRRSKQKQARYCGEGRSGHGTKTRVAPVYQEEDALAAYRDTINHRYSKAVVEYAVKNGYGTIQMEDLTGIKENTGFPRYLRHWTYFDLQSKIKYKAEAAGIAVVPIKPRYTSQRCSKCGYIDAASRTSQETFLCTHCGEKMNADYNASQNISIRGIDKIIEKQLKAQHLREPEEDSDT